MNNCIKSRLTIGNKFNRWTIVQQIDENKWLCKCECGTERVKTKYEFGNSSISCGCFRNETTSKRSKTHGLSLRCSDKNPHKRIYGIWKSMKQRCCNKNSRPYKHYGGRGIKVCKSWMQFEDFYKWAISNGYQNNLTVERIDNDKNYCPENCRWATMREQAQNKRTSKNFTINGITKNREEWTQWAKQNHIPRYSMHLNNGAEYFFEFLKTINKEVFTNA